MMTAKQCLTTMQTADHQTLVDIWKQILTRSTHTNGWPLGRAFELLILQAFHLEGAEVVWPFQVNLFEETIEQIDGVVHLPHSAQSVLIESKDYDSAISIDPIAKMRSQLQRRSNSIVGSVFSVNGFTEPALTLARFMAPQTILLWNQQDIEYCLKNQCFLKGFLLKYRHHIEHGLPDFSVEPLN